MPSFPGTLEAKTCTVEVFLPYPIPAISSRRYPCWNVFSPTQSCFINENRSVANPDLTPRIASIDNLSTLRMYLRNVEHRLFTISQTELNSKTMCQLQTTAFFTKRGNALFHVTWILFQLLPSKNLQASLFQSSHPLLTVHLWHYSSSPQDCHRNSNIEEAFRWTWWT